MKVLFLTPSFYPNIGGVEKHILEVSKVLIEKGIDLTILTEKPKLQKNPISYQSQYGSDRQAKNIRKADLTGYIANKEQNNLNIIELDFGNKGKIKKLRIWRKLWEKRQYIKEADVIHCHDVFIWILPFRFIYFWKPVFTTFHGYETVFPPRKKAILIRKVSEYLSKGNICIGEFIKKWYGTKPDYILYGGINNTKNQELIVNDSKKIRIAFTGRLEKDNCLSIYLKALDNLKRDRMDFSFEVFGDGSLKSEAEKYGLVHGFVTNISYKDIDVVFASSYLSILEAINNKKPVVSVYNNPLKKDYLKMTPFSKFIIIEENYDEITKKIKFLSTNTKFRDHMVEIAYDWVKDQTWDKMANIYIKLWKA